MPQLRMPRRLWNGLLALLLIAVMLVPTYGNKALAGKEGVFINGEAYYTLEKAQLSPGSDKSTFRFTLELVNNSGLTVDINKYGSAVWDASGNRYGAELTEKTSSRVAPGTTKIFKYISKVPTNVTLNELQVEIFEWNFKAASYMNSIGKLSVSAAADASQSTKPQAVVDLSDLDSSYASDSLVTFELQRSYHALVNGTWNLFAEMTAENSGSSSYKLPSGLILNLKNGTGLAFTGSILYGGDATILPHQKSAIIMQFPVGDLSLNDALSIEFGKKTTTTTATTGTSTGNSSGTSTGNSASSVTVTTINVLETMNITGSAATRQKGDIQTNSANRFGLSATMESVSLDSKSDGVYAESVFTLKNDGNKAVSIPVLTAYYQVGGSTLSVAAADSASHENYLAPGESTSYYYNATLPSGLDGSSVQLVVQEQKSSTLNVPVFVASLPAVSDSTGAPVGQNGSTYATSVGKLNITLKSTYRLLNEGGEDTLVSEVQVENQESEAIKLPGMYAIYTDGTNELTGKTVYVQSSAYINARQQATLYLIANVPYDMEFATGKVYFGQGVLSNNTWTQKKEWARMDFTVNNKEIPEISVNDTWYINDPGRLSTGWIGEVKLYDNPNESESSILAAVRIGERNQMTRNGSVVPYTGYIQTSNGEMYPLSTTGTSGKLIKDARALQTLWAKIPSGVLDDKAVVVFGQKIDGTTFANPKTLKFAVTANQPTANASDDPEWKINESLYPYDVKLSGLKRLYASGKYTFEYQFKLEKTTTLADSNTNRVLHYEMEDSTGLVVKSWDVPLEGNGALEDGTQTLILASTEIKYADDFVNGNRLKVYEKFENHLRLLGSLNYMLGDN